MRARASCFASRSLAFSSQTSNIAPRLLKKPDYKKQLGNAISLCYGSSDRQLPHLSPLYRQNPPCLLPNQPIYSIINPRRSALCAAGLTPRKYMGDDLKLDILEKDEITEECKRLWHLLPIIHKKSFCRFQLKDSPDYVEDCVQDVFMALLEAKRAGTEIHNPKAWLTSVANNKIKNEYKNRKRESEHINKIIRYETVMEFSSLDIHDFFRHFRRACDRHEGQCIKSSQRRRAVAGQGFLCEAHEDKKISPKNAAFPRRMSSKNFSGCEKDSTSLKRRDRETENLTF